MEKTLVRETVAIGTVMPDGTIYAGMSPTKNRPMYLAPVKASAVTSFNGAASLARKLQIGDKKDFGVPDREELQVLYENRDAGALRKVFDASASYPACDFWSSTATSEQLARTRCFDDGHEDFDYKSQKFSVCCVRYG